MGVAELDMDNLKKIRLRDYDYTSNGYYFVTIVTKLRTNLLKGRERTFKALLNDVANLMHGVSIDTLMVMSNHIHCILVLNNSAWPLGEIIRRFKAKSSYLYKERLWQANYYEHVIRDEQALHRIREYIINNPEREILKFGQFHKHHGVPKIGTPHT